jgi:hypothetical protein
MRNMLVMPEDLPDRASLGEFKPDFTILNAGGFPANRCRHHHRLRATAAVPTSRTPRGGLGVPPAARPARLGGWAVEGGPVASSRRRDGHLAWCRRYVDGMTSSCSVDLNFARGEMVILGTQYAGEMKKGVLTLMMCLPRSVRTRAPPLLRCPRLPHMAGT